MNDRPGSPLFPETRLTCTMDPASCVPLIPHTGYGIDSLLQASVPPRKTGSRTIVRKEPVFPKDSRYTVWRNGAVHIISESYFYKTEPYYSILRHELEGKTVRPASHSVLDAYVVPVCLERAGLAGIPTCDWEISQGYVPLPSILYGINYFATTSDYVVVDNNENVKVAVSHITNKGKYPFCYQKLPDQASIRSSIAIFGRTLSASDPVDLIASQVYSLFGIPLVTLVLVQDGDRFLLSSLAPTRYSQLSGAERSLLAAYISHQEFL